MLSQETEKEEQKILHKNIIIRIINIRDKNLKK